MEGWKAGIATFSGKAGSPRIESWSGKNWQQFRGILFGGGKYLNRHPSSC